MTNSDSPRTFTFRQADERCPGSYGEPRSLAMTPSQPFSRAVTSARLPSARRTRDGMSGPLRRGMSCSSRAQRVEHDMDRAHPRIDAASLQELEARHAALVEHHELAVQHQVVVRERAD